MSCGTTHPGPHPRGIWRCLKAALVAPGGRGPSQGSRGLIVVRPVAPYNLPWFMLSILGLLIRHLCPTPLLNLDVAWTPLSPPLHFSPTHPAPLQGGWKDAFVAARFSQLLATPPSDSFSHGRKPVAAGTETATHRACQSDFLGLPRGDHFGFLRSEQTPRLCACDRDRAGQGRCLHKQSCPTSWHFCPLLSPRQICACFPGEALPDSPGTPSSMFNFYLPY